MIGYSRLPDALATAALAASFATRQERMHIERPQRAFAGALLALVSLTGCVPDGKGREPDVSNAMPSIYVDIKEEDLVDGKNPGKESYLQTLKLCREAGAAVRELSSEQVQKIGTWRRQRWYSQDFRAMRDERWTYEFEEDSPPDTCYFTLDQLGEHYYTDGSTRVSTDLATGITSRQPELPDALYRMAATGDISNSPDHSGPTTRQVAGQQCLEWTSLPDGYATGTRICLWSEGRAWGFAALPTQYSYCANPKPSVIVLSEEPLSGTGCRISVQSMTVGKPLDPAAYSPPGMDGGAS